MGATKEQRENVEKIAGMAARHGTWMLNENDAADLRRVLADSEELERSKDALRIADAALADVVDLAAPECEWNSDGLANTPANTAAHVWMLAVRERERARLLASREGAAHES